MPNPKLKVLVIDDDPSVGLAFTRVLRGHRPTIETDAVCDVRMPDLDGYRLLAAVRDLEEPPAFVLMSADELPDSSVDADAVVRKPFVAVLSVPSQRRASAITR